MEMLPISKIKQNIESKWGETTSVQHAYRIIDYLTSHKLKSGDIVSVVKILEILEVKELTSDALGALSILSQSDCAVLRTFVIFEDEGGETYRLSSCEFQMVQDFGTLTHPVTKNIIPNASKKVIIHFEVDFS